MIYSEMPAGTTIALKRICPFIDRPCFPDRRIAWSASSWESTWRVAPDAEPAWRPARGAQADAETEEGEACSPSALTLLRDAYTRYPLLVTAFLFSAYYFADAAFYQVAAQR